MEVAIVDHLVAAEALFLRDAGSPGERDELSYRLSLRATTLMEAQPERHSELFRCTQKISRLEPANIATF